MKGCDFVNKYRPFIPFSCFFFVYLLKKSQSISFPLSRYKQMYKNIITETNSKSFALTTRVSSSKRFDSCLFVPVYWPIWSFFVDLLKGFFFFTWKRKHVLAASVVQYCIVQCQNLDVFNIYFCCLIDASNLLELHLEENVRLPKQIEKRHQWQIDLHPPVVSGIRYHQNIAN